MNLVDFISGKGQFDHVRPCSVSFMSSPYVEYEMFKKITYMRHKFDGFFCFLFTLTFFRKML
jgi:hypothetical protein